MSVSRARLRGPTSASRTGSSLFINTKQKLSLTPSETRDDSESRRGKINETTSTINTFSRQKGPPYRGPTGQEPVVPLSLSTHKSVLTPDLPPPWPPSGCLLREEGRGLRPKAIFCSLYSFCRWDPLSEGTFTKGKRVQTT